MLSALMLAATAHAIDPSGLVPAWSVDEPGGGSAALFDDQGALVIAGWVDDAPGSIAMVRGYNPEGSLAWDYTTDPGSGTANGNRWNDLALDPVSGHIALCGQRGGAQSDLDWVVEVIDATRSDLWTVPYGGAATSQEQSCEGIGWGDALATAGTTWQNDTVRGQWLLWQLDPATGLILRPDDLDFGPEAHDRALGIDVFADQSTVVIGRATDPDAKATPGEVSLVVRLLDGTPQWFADLGPDPVDVEAVLVEPLGNRAIVVGTQHTPDGPRAWWGAFNQDAGSPQAPVWTGSFSGLADSGATAVALDDNGGLLVAGWVDGLTPAWRVSQVSAGDGSELGTLELPSSGAPRGVATDGSIIGLVGSDDDGLAVHVLGVDRDEDGVADVGDGCPDDAGKADPGVCGCAVPDVDSDADGFLNCEEDCGADPDKQDPGICGCDIADTDTDGDGSEDCIDECDDDPGKSTQGVCGCGVADSDDDGDGLLVCQDQCPDTPPGVTVDAVGCELSGSATGTTDSGDDDKAPELSGGCGCQASQVPGSSWGIALLALLALGKRRTRVA